MATKSGRKGGAFTTGGGTYNHFAEYVERLMPDNFTQEIQQELSDEKYDKHPFLQRKYVMERVEELFLNPEHAEAPTATQKKNFKPFLERFESGNKQSIVYKNPYGRKGSENEFVDFRDLLSRPRELEGEQFDVPKPKVPGRVIKLSEHVFDRLKHAQDPEKYPIGTNSPSPKRIVETFENRWRSAVVANNTNSLRVLREEIINIRNAGPRTGIATEDADKLFQDIDLAYNELRASKGFIKVSPEALKRKEYFSRAGFTEDFGVLVKNATKNVPDKKGIENVSELLGDRKEFLFNKIKGGLPYLPNKEVERLAVQELDAEYNSTRSAEDEMWRRLMTRDENWQPRSIPKLVRDESDYKRMANLTNKEFKLYLARDVSLPREEQFLRTSTILGQPKKELPGVKQKLQAEAKNYLEDMRVLKSEKEAEQTAKFVSDAESEFF